MTTKVTHLRSSSYELNVNLGEGVAVGDDHMVRGLFIMEPDRGDTESPGYGMGHLRRLGIGGG